MSLLIALTFENSHILAGIYFIFLKNCRRPNLKGSQYQVGPQSKDRESNYQILALVCKLVALILR